MEDKGLFGLDKGSFAEGLAYFFTKGAGYKPVRINKRMKEILLIMINESLENTSIMFAPDDDFGYERFMRSMEWIEQEVTKTFRIEKIGLDKSIGLVVKYWIHDNRYHELAGDPDFDKACQWLTNKINKKYSDNDLVKYDFK